MTLEDELADAEAIYARRLRLCRHAEEKRDAAAKELIHWLTRVSEALDNVQRIKRQIAATKQVQP